MNEEWRKVDICPTYEVSNLGRMRSYKIIREQYSCDGYPRVQLWSKAKSVKRAIHRLVAIAFIPNPEGKCQVNHIDGNRLNNRVENLEWCTPQENTNHAIAMGLKSAKLSANKAVEIRAKYRTPDYTIAALAKEYGVCEKTIDKVLKRTTYKYV